MRRRVKVVLFILEISDGGAETLVKDYALNLDKDLFDVRIVTDIPSDVNSANYRILREHKIPIYCFVVNPYTLFEKIKRKVQRWFLFRLSSKRREQYKRWYIQHLIKHLNPDVLHVHMGVLNYLPKISDFLTSCKLFYTCHSLPERYLNDTDRKEEKEAAKYLIANNGLQMIALQNTMKEQLNNMFRITNTIVLNNCIELERFTKCSVGKFDERKKLHIPQDSFVLGHVGRFHPVKNQSFLVEVFAEVVKMKPNAYLLLVGQGEKEIIENRLRDLNLDSKYQILSNRNDVHEILKAMDVFVFPSTVEGLGLAAVEAQAAGLRTIISSAVPKDVCFSENAIVVDLNDSPAIWAQKILDNTIKGDYFNDLKAFDTKYVIKELENLYIN